MPSHTTCISLVTLFLITQLNAQPPPPPPIHNIPNVHTSMSPLDVLCENPGPCSCPLGTEQPCVINCHGMEACEDGLIECNNDGFPCTVNCMGSTSCSGTTNINGPAGSTLTVNCMSDTTCEGSVYIHGDKGTDLTVACNGPESCVGTVELNFGVGIGSVACTDPQSCEGVIVNLPPNAETTPGVGFSCTGSSCPATAPKSFMNDAQSVTCEGTGPCSCIVGLKDVCIINCLGASDACKDGLIECNNDGYDCFVNCIGFESCSGNTKIMGPADAALFVQCIGEKSCEGALSINAEVGTDLSVVCEGGEACKGNAQFNFGSGAGTVWCNGNPYSCSGTIFNLPVNAQTTPGVSFNCYGDFCPPTAPKTFSNPAPKPIIPAPAPQLPAVPLPAPGASIPIQPSNLATPTCVGNQMNDPQTGDCICPERTPNGQFFPKCQLPSKQDPVSCDCIAAAAVPLPPPPPRSIPIPPLNPATPTCVGNQVNDPQTGDCVCPDRAPNGQFYPRCQLPLSQDPVTCDCLNAPAVSSPVPPVSRPITPIPTTPIPIPLFCCKTRIPNFTPYAGRCWHKTDEISCNSDPRDACRWDETQCFQSRPMCNAKDQDCTANIDCCSDICRTSGAAQGICR